MRVRYNKLTNHWYNWCSCRREHWQLLGNLKTTVEGLVSANNPNVWSKYGGLERLCRDMQSILYHGLIHDQVCRPSFLPDWVKQLLERNGCIKLLRGRRWWPLVCEPLEEVLYHKMMTTRKRIRTVMISHWDFPLMIILGHIWETLTEYCYF